MLYASRRTVAADLSCNASFGGDPRECAPLVARLNALYTRPASGALRQACAELPMDVVVAKDTDGVWKDRRSWVWKESPVFANGYLRLFSCPPRGTPAN